MDTTHTSTRTADTLLSVLPVDLLLSCTINRGSDDSDDRYSDVVVGQTSRGGILLTWWFGFQATLLHAATPLSVLNSIVALTLYA